MEHKELDPYLLLGSRAELLEDFYQLMKSVDGIFDMKEILLEMGEFEEWAELSALEYSLRKTDSEAASKRFEGEIAALKAERDALANRIVSLRRVLRDVMNTSGDGNSVLDTTEALEQDDRQHAKALQAAAKPAGDGGQERGE